MKKIKITHIHIFALLSIALLCCLQIRALDYPVVLNDEFGYWAHAVSAVGYDWKELISETPYYSWGYSIWLIPIIAVLPTPKLWYKAAILQNVVFLLISYCLCYKSGRKLFPQIADKIMALISLIVIIYPSNIIYAQIAWSETLSYLLFWLETYFLIRLDEKFSVKYFLLSLIIPLYGYAVHNRSIGILLAAVISIVVLLIKNRKKAGYYLLIPIALVIGYKGIDLVKLHQMNALWSNSKVSSINNVGLDTATVTQYTSRIFNEMKLLCISVVGKYFYLLISFGLTFPIVIIRFFKELWDNLKAKSAFKDYACSRFWILLSSAAMFGICALQANQWNSRKDTIVYARYMENALGPLLLLAFTEAILYRKELKATLCISIVSILMGIFPVFYYMDNVNAGFNSICSPLIGVFYRMVNDTTKTFILLGIFLALVFAILYLSASLHNIRMGTALILLCFGFTYSILGCILGFQAADSRKGYDENTVPIYEQLSTEYENIELYYVKNPSVDSFSTNPKYLQYLIPDRTIHVILSEEIKDYIGQDVILITNPNDMDNRTFLSDNGAELLQCNYLLAIYSAKQKLTSLTPH